MRPMDEAGRLARVAIGLANRGLTTPQVVEEIRSRFGWVTQEQAEAAAFVADSALASRVGLSLSQPGDTLGSARGLPAGEDREVEVQAVVIIRREGFEPEFRTLNLTARSGDTVDEVSSRVQGIVDDWHELYDVEGRTSTWEFRHVL